CRNVLMAQGFDKNKPRFQDPLVSQEVRANFLAVATNNAGSTAPKDPEIGTFWLDTSVSTNVRLKCFLSGAWIVILSNIQAGPPSQSNVDKFVHRQETGAATWTITHTLDTTDISVMVYDSTGKFIIPDEV